MLILNAGGLQIRPSGIYLVALQMLILNAGGLQIRPSGVDKPEDYLYSSARDYCGGKGLIDVTVTI